MVYINPKSTSRLPDYRTTRKLDPKDSVYYFLAVGGQEFDALVLRSIDADKMWITVESFAGEVARIPGEQIKEALMTEVKFFPAE